MCTRIPVLKFLACLFWLAPAIAAADDPYYPSHCSEQWVLDRIAGNFAWTERTQWRRGFVIDRIDTPRLRYQVNYGPTTIQHDHCQARALMTNGRIRNVYYTVERRQGFASIGSKVRYCIIGLDPWRVYGAACSTVR